MGKFNTTKKNKIYLKKASQYAIILIVVFSLIFVNEYIFKQSKPTFDNYTDKSTESSYLSKSKMTCYWCGNKEECERYLLQYLDGYNPDGSFKYGYSYKYMSTVCASDCRSSGKFVNVTKD